MFLDEHVHVGLHTLTLNLFSLETLSKFRYNILLLPIVFECTYNYIIISVNNV
jgi:hypothetical protein